MPEEPFTHEVADIGEQIPYVPKPVSIPANQGGMNNKFYSPLVLNIANSEGIPMAELDNIRGTGNEGRVTKKDILQYVDGRKSGKITEQPPVVQMAEPEKEFKAKGRPRLHSIL